MSAAGGWWARQAESWREDKREWKSSLLRCPVVACSSSSGGGGGGEGDGIDDVGGRSSGEERERRAALIARLSIAGVTAVFALYVCVDHLVDHPVRR